MPLMPSWAQTPAIHQRNATLCQSPAEESPQSVSHFIPSDMSDSLWCHGCSMWGFPVHHQLPEPTQTHVHWSWWCHPTIHSSVVPFFSCLQSFPASGFFPVSQFFTSGNQSIGASALASVLPINIQDWFPLGLTGWIYWQSKGLSRVLQHHSSKASIFQHSAYFLVQLSHPYIITGKTISLTRWTFVSKVMSLLFKCCLGLS